MSMRYRDVLGEWIWHIAPFTLPILVILVLLFG